MHDQTPRPAPNQPTEQPDRFERYLRVLLQEHFFAQADARGEDPEDAEVLLAQAAALQTVTRIILAAEIRREHPNLGSWLVHCRAMRRILQHREEAARAGYSRVKLTKPTTTRPDGNEPAAQRLIEAVAAAYVTSVDHSTRTNLRDRQLRLIQGRVYLLYRTLFELAVEQMRIDLDEAPDPTRNARKLLTAHQQRTQWADAARAAAIEKATAEEAKEKEERNPMRTKHEHQEPNGQEQREPAAGQTDPLEMALLGSTGRRYGALLDDAARYALVSLAQDVRAIRERIAHLPAPQDGLSEVALDLAAAAPDLERAADCPTGTDREDQTLA